MTAKSHVVGATDTPLLQETIGHALRRAARGHGGRAALTSLVQGIELDYAALDRAVDRIAHSSANRWVCLVTRLGVVRVGTVPAPINPASRTDKMGYVRVVDDFPATASGKVQRFRMRETEMEERGMA